MKYTLLFAALFAFSLNLHAQSDPSKTEDATPADPSAAPAASAPAASAPSQTMEAQDQKGEIKETITAEKPSAAKAKTEAKTSSEAKPAKAIVTQDLKGEIESIDATNKTFVVAGKTFKLWSSGKIFFKRKVKSLSDLKVGDRVAVTYREAKDGSLEASRINK